MNGANCEARFAKVWSSQSPYSKLGLIATMAKYGV